MAIPVALFARAAALGIAKYLVNKWGAKKAAREIAKEEKKRTIAAGKKFIKGKQKTATQRKKPKVDAGLSIRQQMAKDLDLPANYGQRHIRKALERKDLPEKLKQKYKGRGDVPRKEEFKISRGKVIIHK